MKCISVVTSQLIISTSVFELVTDENTNMRYIYVHIKAGDI